MTGEPKGYTTTYRIMKATIPQDPSHLDKQVQEPGSRHQCQLRV